MGETIIRMLTLLFTFRTDTTSERNAEESVANFARNAMRQLKGISEVAATIAFDKIVQNLLKATSQAEDTAFVFENIYGDMSDAQAAWAEKFADTYNRSATKVKESLASIQHEMVGFTKAGTAEQKQNVAEMSKLIEEAGLNLGAFYGMDSKTAINTLLSATQGSDAAMQTFNVGEGKQVVARRHEAMRELRNEGLIDSQTRSYENLSLYEKAMVNLRTVMNANKDATDALARSQNNYSVMQENLQESLTELKEVLGQFFLPTAKKIVDFLVRGVRFLTDIVEEIKKVTDWLGITEQAMDMLAMLITVLVSMRVVTWAAGIVRALQGLAGAAGAAAGGMSGLAASAGAAIAILLVVVMVVQDLNKFLRGEQSKTGSILEKLGIDAEKAAPFIEALRNVIVALTIAMTVLKVVSIATGTAMMATPVGWIVAAIAALIAIIVVLVKHWDKVKAAVVNAFNAVKNAVTSVFDWIKEKISKIPDWALLLSAMFTGPIGPIIVLKRHMNEIAEWFKKAFGWIRDKISKIPDWALLLSSLFLGPIGPIILLIRHFDKLKDAAKNAWEWVKKLFGGGKQEGEESGKDMVDGFAEGMDKENPKLAASAEQAAETVADYTHFSLPKKGPLSDFDESMPDMIQMMVNGVKNGRSKLADASSGLASSILNTIARIQNNRENTRNGIIAALTGLGGGVLVTQNITFNQEFKGPEAMEQKVIRASNESIDDITTSVARALEMLPA